MITKKEMIERMQETEAKLEKQLSDSARKYGYEDDLTKQYLSTWAGVYELMKDLGIKTKRGEA